jgi:competence protein ComEA
MTKTEKSALGLILFFLCTGLFADQLRKSNEDIPLIPGQISVPLAMEAVQDSLSSSESESPPKTVAPKIDLTLDSPVRINSASVAELCRIKGIGKVTANKIIDYRTQKGRFTKPADLLKVKGIGPKKLKLIQSQVEFD